MTLEEQKKWLFFEMIIASIVTASFLTLTLLMAFSNTEFWHKIIVISISFIQFIVGVCICLKIEQIVGKYECSECGHRYVPTYKAVSLAVHVGRIRYLKCPHCRKKSWNKKVLG